MVLGIDRETFLYAVGVLLGVAAVAYFGFELFDLISPVTTAALLFATFLCLLVVGIGFDVETLDVVAYALAAGCYLVFVAYVFSQFDVGDGGTFLLLAVSSALFIGLGYLSQRGRLDISRGRAKLVVVVVVLVAVALVGVDLVGAQPTTSTSVEDSVDVPDERESVTVGSVTVANGFFLPRETDVERYGACVYGPDLQPAPIKYDPVVRGGLLGGGESRTYDLVLTGRAFYDENGRLREGFESRESVPVERASECPETGDEPKVVVVPESAVRPPYR